MLWCKGNAPFWSTGVWTTATVGPCSGVLWCPSMKMNSQLPRATPQGASIDRVLRIWREAEANADFWWGTLHRMYNIALYVECKTFYVTLNESCSVLSCLLSSVRSSHALDVQIIMQWLLLTVPVFFTFFCTYAFTKMHVVYLFLTNMDVRDATLKLQWDGVCKLNCACFTNLTKPFTEIS